MSISRWVLTAPSRLHFGLLAWGEEAPRQFGSVGLMIVRPGLVVSAEPADEWSAHGPYETRVLGVIAMVVAQWRKEHHQLSPLHIRIESAPPEHVGFGTGTQISLAVARLILAHAGESEPTARCLARLTGRGKRSGIGLHGAIQGGLLVDGGRGPATQFPPLLARHDFPEDWSILVIVPPGRPGLSAELEREAFARLPGMPRARIDRLSRLVLLELLPAVVERDFQTFGLALSEIQREVGMAFSPAQGGIYADLNAKAMVARMIAMGLVGVGQSSWGPVLYGFGQADERRRETIRAGLRETFKLDEASIFWTTACNRPSLVGRD